MIAARASSSSRSASRPESTALASSAGVPVSSSTGTSRPDQPDQAPASAPDQDRRDDDGRDQQADEHVLNGGEIDGAAARPASGAACPGAGRRGLAGGRVGLAAVELSDAGDQQRHRNRDQAGHERAVQQRPEPGPDTRWRAAAPAQRDEESGERRFDDGADADDDGPLPGGAARRPGRRRGSRRSSAGGAARPARHGRGVGLACRANHTSSRPDGRRAGQIRPPRRVPP